jgi:hypothetical protein
MNLRPQNQRAEWLAFRFCSFYLAAYTLWKMLDFRRKSYDFGFNLKCRWIGRMTGVNV